MNNSVFLKWLKLFRSFWYGLAIYFNSFTPWVALLHIYSTSSVLAEAHDHLLRITADLLEVCLDAGLVERRKKEA